MTDHCREREGRLVALSSTSGCVPVSFAHKHHELHLAGDLLSRPQGGWGRGGEGNVT